VCDGIHLNNRTARNPKTIYSNKNVSKNQNCWIIKQPQCQTEKSHGNKKNFDQKKCVPPRNRVRMALNRFIAGERPFAQIRLK
jgi:hypothetical protein